MTEDELIEIERLAAAATPGPWEANGLEVFEQVSAHGDLIADAGLTSLDARFIAAARQAVPELIAEIRRLRAVKVGYPPGLAPPPDDGPPF